ncbi:MAG: amidohydrolase family protein [Pseudomonadota bacterium]
MKNTDNKRQAWVFSLFVTSALAVFAACSNTSAPEDYEGAVEYTGAMVWTDGTFVQRDLVVHNGQFKAPPRKKPPQMTSVDMTGKFITPPFGDAHTHKIEGVARLESFNRQYIEEGVFYVQNPAGLPRLMTDSRPFTDRPETIDAKYSMGAITTPFGHPERGYVEFMTRYAYKGETRESMRGTAIHAVKTEDDVKRAIEILVEDKADFVKIILEGSEDYETQSAIIEEIGPNTEGVSPFVTSGMNPDLVPTTVRYAGEAGLAVKAHVATAYDFKVAVEAGVDQILHMPGTVPKGDKPLDTYILDADIAQAAAEADIAVVATAAVRLEFVRSEMCDQFFKDDCDKIFPIQKQNMRTLLDNGVSILIGTDNYFARARSEVDHVREIEAMSDAEALTAWIATGPGIFPERKIGALQPGYEADFLVLDANPLTDFTTLDRIETRVKGGETLVLE